MRINEIALRSICRTTGDREGRLLYKSPKESYRQRWFKLKGNLLFYYRANEKGQQAELEPSGVLVLERCSVKLEPISDRPFVFSVEFDGEGGRIHYFSGQTQQQCEDWVTSITMASIYSLRAESVVLRKRIQEKTGKDPMEDLYRKLTASRVQLSLASTTRVPTRQAPAPPKSSSTFYDNDSQEVLLGIKTLRHDVLQSSRQPWVTTNPHRVDGQLSTGTQADKPKDTQGASYTKTGWELFE